jgi:hypothetical protein
MKRLAAESIPVPSLCGGLFRPRLPIGHKQKIAWREHMRVGSNLAKFGILFMIPHGLQPSKTGRISDPTYVLPLLDGVPHTRFPSFVSEPSVEA